MGCDIHVFIETQDSEGQWQTHELEDSPLNHRNYLYFALFAGVRNNFSIFIKPLGFNQGLPVDVSHSVSKAYYTYYSEEHDEYILDKDNKPKNDNHSPHWISLKELSQFAWDTPILNHIDYSGYNKDYDSYPLALQKYFTRREPMSKKTALAGLLPYCSYSQVETQSPKKLTLEHLLGSELVQYIHDLYQQYPEGRLVYYFDN